MRPQAPTEKPGTGGYRDAADLVGTLNDKIRQLESEKHELMARIRAMPSIDPLCVRAGGIPTLRQKQEDFGIAIFGHTNVESMAVVLEGLHRQDALPYAEVWLDGHQGDRDLQHRTDSVHALLQKYPVKKIHRQAGRSGRDKIVILGLVEMCKKYKDILILEENCFPTHDAVVEFRQALEEIRGDKAIFSVYGQHFLIDRERPSCARFQRWGWATTSKKLMPVLRQLIDCYSMSEENYLRFANLALTPDIKAAIDIMPHHQPSATLKRFFAWAETLGLLAAMNHQVHRPTRTRTIYNCGLNQRNQNDRDFRAPPYNLIAPDEVWGYF